MAKIGDVVRFNRGAGPEYGIILDHDEDGGAIVGKVEQAEEHSYKQADGGEPDGGEFVVVK